MEDFDNYISMKKSFVSNTNKLVVKHELSHNSAGLQIVDFICGSIFQHYERNNFEYFDIIKEKCIKGKVWP